MSTEHQGVGEGAEHAADVLLVEDDEAAAMLIARGVSSMGFTVKRAYDGEQAILITHNNLPSMVLMDIMMPRLDGLETTRYLKTRYDGYLPVMVITAREDRESLSRAQAAGVDDYMTKPVRVQRLRARIQRLMALRAAEDQIPSADAVEAVIRLRVEIADELCDLGRAAIARVHLDRLRDLAPAHEAVIALGRKLDA